MRAAIEEGAFPAFDAVWYFSEAHEEIYAAVSEQVEGWGDVPSGFIGRRCLRAPRLTRLSAPPDDVQVVDVYRVGKDRVAVAILYTADGTVTCDVYEERG